MKRFFTSMLGALAAIWISITLLAILGIIMLVSIISIALRDQTPPEVKDNSILYINLATVIDEINPQANLQTLLYDDGMKVTLLQPTIDAIRYAETDPRIKGIYIDAGAVSSGVASLNDLVQALEHFRTHSNKWVVAYGDQITQSAYYIASVADEIYLNPQGMVDIHGLSSSVYFYKGLLDKLGVEMQVLKVGTFKSAVEPYLLDSISAANREQMEQYMGEIWGLLSTNMSRNRHIAEERFNNLADSMLLTVAPDSLVAENIVDKLAYRHQVEEMLVKKSGLSADHKPRLVDVGGYYAAIKDNITVSSDNKIALVYAVGEISDEGREGVVAATLVPHILQLADDKDIKGMVLRVNSPGGSAFASEQIWEAIETFKKKGKKVYVSMGNVAASGGYYISCGADRIYASPVTLTGSIGIFGIVPNVKGLLNEHLGITVGTVTTNSNGDFPSITAPMTPFQHARMQNMIERGYETFVSRVAEGRKMPVDDIKAIAEGRVWAGVTALNIGLVDELGNLDAAIKGLTNALNLKDYELVVYPNPKASVWDVLMSLETDVAGTVMRKAMGEQAYEIYRKAKRMESLNMVQCRMEEGEVQL